MNKLKVKAVFFDLWNTIAFTDSNKDLFKEMQIRFGLNELMPSQFIQECEQAIMVEKFETMDHLYAKLLNHFSIASGEILLGDLDFLWNHTLKHDKPFPESKKVLEKTKKHFKTALISNCESFGFKKILNDFGFKKYFNEIILSCEVGLLKPHPKIFHLALKKLKVKPEQAVMVGDSIRTDINGAKHAGLKTILIDRKQTFKKNSSKNKGKKIEVDAVISSLNELTKLLEF